MMLEKLGHLSQIVSGVILVVGVGMVVIELRQAKALAQAQLLSDSFAIDAERLVAQLGENSAATVAKACRGEPLTYDDAAVLASKYQLHMLMALREWRLAKLYDFEAVTWKQAARAHYLYTFRTAHGRAWFEGIRSSLRALGPETDLDAFRNALYAEYSVDEGCPPSVDAIVNVGARDH